MSTLPRTLADELRSRSDEQLALLLDARPDLLSPPPRDVSELARRATAGPSVWQAINQLDLFSLQVLEALVALPEPSSVRRLAEVLHVDPSAALELLRTRALVWGPPEALRTVQAARRLMPAPAGLGPPGREVFIRLGPARLASILARLGLPPEPSPPAAADRLSSHLGDVRQLQRVLRDAPAGAVAVLDQLTWGPPTATLPPGLERDWLAEHGLIVETNPGSSGTVVLPREVALAARGGQVHRVVSPIPPALTGQDHDPAQVDHAAAGNAATVLRLVDELLTRWRETPPPVLRGGGLGLRELRRAAGMLGVPLSTTQLLLSLAWAAGLLHREGAEEPGWGPAPSFDAWRRADPAVAWAILAQAWLVLPDDPPGEQDRPWAPEVPEPGEDWREVVPIRRLLLDTLADAPPGRAVHLRSLRARLSWVAPRAGRAHRPELIAALLDQAAQLGLTGLGALSVGGRALDGGRHELQAVADRLRGWLPEPVHEVLVQADLTVIAPGPLAPDIADELRLFADVESTGAGTVFRVSAASLRRALDAGRTAEQIERFLATHARAPIPQPLQYLLADTARRHGRLRVGAASSYLRSDDEALLAALVADPANASLGLRLLAPTVAVARVSPTTLVTRLTAAGHAPSTERETVPVPQGPAAGHEFDPPDRRATPPDEKTPSAPQTPSTEDRFVRTDERDERSAPTDDAALSFPLPSRPGGQPQGALPQAVVAATVRSLRGLTGAHAPAPQLTTVAPQRVRSLLTQAARCGQAVWVGYTDATGTVTSRFVEPVHVADGQVLALDRTGEPSERGLRQLSLARITGVAAPAGAEPADQKGLQTRE
jgi:hypothetical protein